MADRTVTDSAGRTWTCAALPSEAGEAASTLGRDVVVSCATPSVADPVRITVGWQWLSMSANGLARMVSLASPVPRG
jgi:hypothetical protein